MGGLRANGWDYYGYGIWTRPLANGQMEAVTGFYQGPPEEPQEDE